jgi:hypothetical protein
MKDYTITFNSILTIGTNDSPITKHIHADSYEYHNDDNRSSYLFFSGADKRTRKCVAEVPQVNILLIEVN